MARLAVRALAVRLDAAMETTPIKRPAGYRHPTADYLTTLGPSMVDSVDNHGTVKVDKVDDGVRDAATLPTVSEVTTARPRQPRTAVAVAALTASLPTVPASHVSLINEFLAELQRRDPDGTLLARSEDLHHIAEIAADRAVDTASLWVEHLGTFFDTEAVATILGRNGEKVSRQAVSKRRGLLALTTGSGQVVYPTFQFRGQQPAPGLSQVLAHLPENVVSRWTVASWLRSPAVDLDSQAPIDVLFESGPEGRAAVVNAARAWSVQLAE